MKNIFLKLSVLLVIFFIGTSAVSAASFKVTVGNQNLSKGNTTKLTIKGTDVTGRFNIKSSNPNIVSISEDRAWIENDTYTIKLSALNVGTSTITITPVGVSDGSGNAANLSAKTIKITVSLPREKSTDNSLNSLKIESYELSPEFNKDTLDYSVNVPEGTTNINIIANATSKYASINGAGNKQVVEGINNLSVVVKAENGAERIYNIVVNVIDQNPINVNLNNINYTVIKLRKNYICPELFSESEVIINNIPIPACTNEMINYTLVGLKKDDGTIENFKYENGKYVKYNELTSANIKLINEKYDGIVKGLKETKVKINDVEYQAFKFSNSSKYFVIYGINIKTGEKGLFVYDEVNQTFQGYDTEYIDFLVKQNETYLYVIIAFGCGLFLSIICIFILNKNKKKMKRKYKENKKDIKEQNDKKDLEIKGIEENKETENIIEEQKEINEDNTMEEDVNEVKEINNDEKTQTYYLFESDRKKKRKK